VNRNARRPKLGDEIHAGDSVVTGADGEVHLDMEDGGYMGVRPNTNLRISEFRAEGADTDRSVLEICLAVGLQSVGSFTTTFTRVYGMSPTAYRATFPPAAQHALVPACVIRAYGRPQHRTFREDSVPAGT